MPETITSLIEKLEGADRNVMAAAMFPADWARMESMTGKRRSRMRATLRNRAAYQTGLAALPASAACATCAHHGRYPTDKRMTCDLDSDFHGYAIVKPDHKCPRWSPLSAQSEARPTGEDSPANEGEGR